MFISIHAYNISMISYSKDEEDDGRGRNTLVGTDTMFCASMLVEFEEARCTNVLVLPRGATRMNPTSCSSPSLLLLISVMALSIDSRRSMSMSWWRRMLGGGGHESSIDGEERCSVVGVRRMNDDMLRMIERDNEVLLLYYQEEVVLMYSLLGLWRYLLQ